MGHDDERFTSYRLVDEAPRHNRGAGDGDAHFTPYRPVDESPWRNQRQLVSTLALIGVVIALIMALYLIQTTTTTTTARQLREMDATRQALESGNELVRGQIAELQSLPLLMTRAATMGFRPAEESDIVYLPVEGYRYNRPRVTPTPTPAPTEPGDIYDETLGGWLEQQWDTIRRQFDEWREG